MHSTVSHLLKTATGFLCSYLQEVLPSISQHWWNERVLRNLTPQQQRFVRDRRISSLSGLDLAALLRILDRNWFYISEKKCIPSDDRLYVKEMNAVRNRWAHASTDEPPKDDTYRDLDTLQRFARIIEADLEFIKSVKAIKEQIFAKKVVPDFVFNKPPEQRASRRIVPNRNRTTEIAGPAARPRHVDTTRRRRDPQLEATLKTSMVQILKDKLGESFTRRGDSQFVFSPSGMRYLCKYSSFKRDQSRWFWGVSRKYWLEWGAKDHLVLILEDESGRGYSYLLLDSALSEQLLSKCGESNGEKKINMRIYMTYREVRFQEWQGLSIKDSIKPILLDSSPLSSTET